MGTRKQVSARQPTTQDDIVLPEDEQWRIIDNSGILHGVKRPSEPSLNDNDSDDERASEPHTAASTEHNREEGQIDDLFDNLFQAVLLIVPMCFLYAMMDLSVCNNPIARGRLAYHLARKLVSNAVCTAPYLLGGNQAGCFCHTRYATHKSPSHARLLILATLVPTQ